MLEGLISLHIAQQAFPCGFARLNSLKAKIYEESKIQLFSSLNHI